MLHDKEKLKQKQSPVQQSQAGTLINTGEVSKMGPSEIQQDFWSCSESGLDGYDSGYHEDKYVPPDAEGKVTLDLEEEPNQRRNRYLRIQTNAVSFKNINTVDKNSSRDNLRTVIDSNRSESNIYNHLASERNTRCLVPSFPTKMIKDIPIFTKKAKK